MQGVEINDDWKRIDREWHPLGRCFTRRRFDGKDVIVWQRNPSVGNLTDWQANYGIVAPLSAATSVAEPSTGKLLLVVLGVTMSRIALPSSTERTRCG
ncbi:hypothetical protein Pr1d_36620 [Bythopirellula goksoeyrii]|uniref:Uncharacterized protein n=1 Tax=Bythopirellula goksoeyrii TaxID=1400387 RepID=A0A5B9QBN3_9BACT|nr:hypothetical protein Pr1d_36620 [Bythopirellula goksoeyrii]